MGGKKSPEFFPHILKESATIKALELLYKNDGYACWFKLLEVLGVSQDNKYECKTKDQCLFLLDKFKIDGKTMSNILNTMCELGAIDKKEWKENRTLFVPNLVLNINKLKRKTLDPKTNLCKPEPKQPDKNKKQYLTYVFLTDEEYQKLCNKYSKEITNDWIERLNNWIAEKPSDSKRKKDSHYHTILNWDRMKKEKEKNNPQPKKLQYRDLSNHQID